MSVLDQYILKYEVAFAPVDKTGHNGAGKSTLSNILCCDTAATEGDIHVFGHSVSTDPYAVRKLVGLCKQGKLVSNE